MFQEPGTQDDNVNKHSYLVELHSSKKRETIHKKIENETSKFPLNKNL